MAEVFITGHRNPDLDSLCSALAYADLKNLTDPENTYIPVRCSHMSEDIKTLLPSLEIDPPRYMRNVYPKVSDVMLTSVLDTNADQSLSECARLITERTPSAFPIFDNGKFYGLLSIDDISAWTMKNLADFGEITSIPTVREIMREQARPLQADDLFEEGKNAFLNGNKRGLAVFRGDEYAGYVTRRCFLNTPKYNVILVDHNEMGQSIQGVESANILEIIDHHRLNAMKTSIPLFIDAEPLGSTCTIVYQLFLRNGLRPSPQTARILLTGIISDTLVLKSPTTTQTDIGSAYSLAAMCRIDLEDYGRKVFSNIEGLSSREPVSAISSDFKTYSEKSMKIGIGQCEVTTLKDLEEYCSTYLNALDAVKAREGLDWALLMITDVISEHSILLSTDCSSEKQLPYARMDSHVYDMPGVMSRKKQLLPEIINSI